MPGRVSQLRRHWLIASCAVILLAYGVVGPLRVAAQEPSSSDPLAEPIVLSGDYAQEWQEVDGTRICLVRGNCRLVQGQTVMTGQKLVVWRRQERVGWQTQERLTAYFEDGVRIERPSGTSHEPSLLVELTTRAGVTEEIHARLQDTAATDDPVFQRALHRRSGSRRVGLRQTQLTVESGPEFPGVYVPPPTTSLRRVRIAPRSFGIPPTIESRESLNTIPPEQVWIVTGGVVLLIEGVEDFGIIDLAADRMVIWTQASDVDTLGDFEALQTSDTPLQVYLEGNIVVRQGESVVRASRAFFDARENRGLVLDADVQHFVPALGGNLRIQAERVRLLSQDSLHAQNAWITTSQFGEPGYRLEASDVFLEQRTGASTPWLGRPPPVFDPLTGAPLDDGRVPWVTSLNNRIFLERYPIFYVPYLSGPAEDPNVPLRRVSFHQDRVFGSQIRTVWDGFKLFGLAQIPGVEWNVQADYLSERGPALGTSGEYSGIDPYFGGEYFGGGQIYYVYDEGEDNLGLGRRSLEPPDENRYRMLWRHRHRLPEDEFLLGEVTVLQAELGILSDINFLEQYFEDDFDEDKDQETLLYLKRQANNWAGTLLVQPQTNDFYTTTQWLPKADLYALSEPLFDGFLTWSMHSELAYADVETADIPGAFQPLYGDLPYFADTSGPLAMTRHELNAPFNLGPLNVVPYVLGEAAHFGEGFDGDQVNRLYGSAGVRSSILFWNVFPQVRSDVFNLHGLAHKMSLHMDWYVAEASRDLDEIPQYHEFDDNAQEQFRQRFLVHTFGGALPAPYDPRSYAVRTGTGRNVTAPQYELVDDQHVIRLGWRHRLQTKVGPPDRMRVRNWMTLDNEISLFPDADRDNFGEDFGLFRTHYNWFISDRTTIMASALYDFFDEGQEIWNVGVMSQRSLRGSIYVGLHQIRGFNIDSRTLTASYSYLLSPKWISTFGTAYDLAEGENRGQSLTVVRLGKDFNVHVGFNYDAGKDNVGAAVAVEPRFGARTSAAGLLNPLLVR